MLDVLRPSFCIDPHPGPGCMERRNFVRCCCPFLLLTDPFRRRGEWLCGDGLRGTLLVFPVECKAVMTGQQVATSKGSPAMADEGLLLRVC